MRYGERKCVEGKDSENGTRINFVDTGRLKEKEHGEL